MSFPCDCVARMNEKLAARNARIAFCFGVTSEHETVMRLLVQTEKLDRSKRGKAAPLVIATHCPFCGQAAQS